MKQDNALFRANSPVLVVHVIVHLSAGGAELMMKRLILAQSGGGDYNHAVISLRGLGSIGPELQSEGIPVYALGIDSPLQMVRAIPKLIRLLRKLRPSIVQTWMYHADLIGGIAARMAGHSRVVWNVRIAQIGPEIGVSRTTTWIMKACAALSSIIPHRIVYVAQSARELHEIAGYAASKGVTIPNGYRVPELAPEWRKRLLRELGLDDGAILLGSAGRFNAQKDHQSFVAACAAIAAEHPAVHFVMFGAGVDQGNPALRDWIGRTRFAARFHLLGERRDFPDVVQVLDVFCLHSRSEGFPNVVAEAMAAGVPCVVTDVGDAALLVDDLGWVVPPNDARLLADALRQALSLNAPLRKQMGERARDRIARSYSINAISDDYAKLYRGMLTVSSPAASGEA